MKGSQEPIETLIDRVRTMTREDVLKVVGATERFSAEKNQALLKARQLAFKRVEGWTDRLNEVENATVRQYTVTMGKGDSLQLVVFRVAIEAATLAIMAKPGLSAVEYRRLVKPASQVMDWLADESGVDTKAPAEPEVASVEDDDEDRPNTSEENEEVAIATKPTAVSKEKVNQKQKAQRAASVASTPVTPEPAGKNGNGDAHQPTEFFADAKKAGVRVKPTRGGFSVCVIGENHRVLTGHYPTAEAAKKAAEAKGLSVKKMPGDRAIGHQPVGQEEKPNNVVEMKPKNGLQRAAETIKAESVTHPAPKPSAKKKK